MFKKLLKIFKCIKYLYLINVKFPWSDSWQRLPTDDDDPRHKRFEARYVLRRRKLLAKLKIMAREGVGCVAETVFIASEREEVIKTQLKGHFNLIPLSLSRWLSRRPSQTCDAAASPAKSWPERTYQFPTRPDQTRPDRAAIPANSSQVKPKNCAASLRGGGSGGGVRKKPTLQQHRCNVGWVLLFLSLMDTQRKI